MKSRMDSSGHYDHRALTRPIARSGRGVVSTGHQFATLAGIDVLRRGGNAIDAGVAAGICLNVVHHDMTSFGGVAPIMLYSAEDDRVVSISGLGRWPKGASLAHFWEMQNGMFTEGLAHCVVPAAADAWITALERYGTLSFAEVSAAALDYAREGFPVHDYMAHNFDRGWAAMERWPETAELVAPGGHLLKAGDHFKQPALAATLQRLVDAESSTEGDREAGVRAARDRFYRGDIAADYVAFSEKHGGFFTMDDFAEFHVKEEPTVRLALADVELHACGPWSQGPVLPQALAILEHVDLRALGHNSPAYLHAVISALDLAFADREHYYGDPEFIDVPMTELLDPHYAAQRASLIVHDKAFGKLPPPGDPRVPSATRVDYRWPPAGDWETTGRGVARPPTPPEPDTSYVAVADAAGNLFSATPSDTFTTYLSGPIVPALGLPLSGRGKQSRLDPAHPASIAPWKRPRLTPSPALLLKDGRPFMVLGTPGGDVQPQAMLQVLLNLFVWNMDLQTAVEAPRVASYNFPGSFYPYHYRPGQIAVEGAVGEDVAQQLEGFGYHVNRWPRHSWRAGSVLVALVAGEGRLEAAADFRREAVALGW